MISDFMRSSSDGSRQASHSEEHGRVDNCPTKSTALGCLLTLARPGAGESLGVPADTS